MPDLILRPSGLPAPREFRLQLRWHDSCGPTEYADVALVSEAMGRDIIAAGQAYWLFGDPQKQPAENISASSAVQPNR